MKGDKTLKRKRLLSFIAVFLTACLLLALCLELRLRSSAISAAQSRAVAYASQIINSAAQTALEGCSSPVSVSEGSDGISGVQVDVAALTKMRTAVTDSLCETLKAPSIMSYSLPLGSITDSTLLSGRGTELNIRLVPLGDVISDVRTEFISVGINQTLHKIILRVTVSLNIFINGQTLKTELKNDITLAETVIVGKVPDAYTAINRWEIDEQEENDLNDYAATLP